MLVSYIIPYSGQKSTVLSIAAKSSYQMVLSRSDTERPLASYIQRSNKISRNALGFDEERFREQFSTHIFPPNGRSS